MRPTAHGFLLLPALLLLAACGSGKSPTPAAADAPGVAAKPGAAAAEAEATPGGPVTLEAEQVAKLGIKVHAAAAATYHEEHEGFGQVWSHEAIAQLVADVATANAAAMQSSAALARARKLGDSPGAFPADTVDSAQRQAATDEVALQLAERKLTALLGDHLPYKIPGAELSALATGQLKLVRVTFPLGAGPRHTPAQVRLFALNAAGDDKGWQARAIWNAPADAAVPGYSFWVAASGDGLLEGDRLVARAPEGAALAGALVPDAAVLVSDDKTWCLLEQPTGTFRRIEIDTRRPVDGGYVVHQGINPGDRLVVHGGGLLLARMMGSADAGE
jgi:hypothetical protein